MTSRPSIVFLKALCGFLIGMNAFALVVLAFAFALGFGAPEQRWEWVWNSGLSMLVLLPLLVMVLQAERWERERSKPCRLLKNVLFDGHSVAGLRSRMRSC